MQFTDKNKIIYDYDLFDVYTQMLGGRFHPLSEKKKTIHQNVATGEELGEYQFYMLIIILKTHTTSTYTVFERLLKQIMPTTYTCNTRS